MPVITSTTNQALPLRGVTAAAFPALAGKIVYEREAKVMLPASVATPATIIMRVVRSNATFLLDFQYRLSLAQADYDDALRLCISFPVMGTALSFADFRVDGPGVLPPNYFESSQADLAVFRFDYGLAVGRDSRFCFVSTNAREFSETGGTVKLLLHNKKFVSVDGPAPLGPAIGRFMASAVDKASLGTPGDFATTQEHGDPSSSAQDDASEIT